MNHETLRISEVDHEQDRLTVGSMLLTPQQARVLRDEIDEFLCAGATSMTPAKYMAAARYADE